MPWVCIVPKSPSLRLMALIAETLNPSDEYAKRRLKAVDFSLDGYAISGAMLNNVGTAVADGRVRIEVGDTGPNFAAAYTVGADRHFTLREHKSPPDDNWRSQVIHESIHAAFDLEGKRPPNEIDEAVAYLGETVWFRAGGLGRVVTAPDAAAKIYGAATEIENRLSLHTKPGQRLTRAQAQALIAAINGHPGYAPSAAQ
jgi:hypothetical protein